MAADKIQGCDDVVKMALPPLRHVHMCLLLSYRQFQLLWSNSLTFMPLPMQSLFWSFLTIFSNHLAQNSRFHHVCTETLLLQHGFLKLKQHHAQQLCQGST